MTASKGPWRILRGRSVLHVVGADGSGVCGISLSANHVHEDYPGCKRDYIERQKANAAMVAATADLLQALETTASNIRSLGPAGALGPVPLPYREWLAVVESAIAKTKVQP